VDGGARHVQVSSAPPFAARAAEPWVPAARPWLRAPAAPRAAVRR
jgi:hypothetical protein